MKKLTVLFPTDFSTCANNALEYTLRFIQFIPFSNLVLLHSIDYEDSTFIAGREREEENTKRYNEAKDKIDQILINIRKNYPAIKCKQILDAGTAHKTIDWVAESEKVDLIIMGTKGASGIKEVLIGSYASRVIKCAPCPVLVIPEEFKFTDVRDIVCCIDFHETESKSLIFAKELAKYFNANVKLLNVDDDSIEQNRKMYNFQKKHVNGFEDESNIVLLKSNDVVDAIENYLKNNEADMLVTLGKKKDFWGKLLGKNVSRSLSFHTSVPLLSFPFQGC